MITYGKNKIQDLVEDIERLLLPADKHESVEVLKSLLHINRLSPNITSVYFAHLREFFGKDAGGFVGFCQSELGMEGKYMFQLVAVGKMILQLRTAAETGYVQRLLQLDFGKNIILTKIPAKELPRFLRAWQLEDMSRDLIRITVNKLLGIVVKKDDGNEQLELFKFVDAISSYDDDMFSLAAESFDYTAAQKSAIAAMGLSQAAIAFFRSHESEGDALFLSELEAEYRAKAQEIAELRIRIAAIEPQALS